MPISRRTLIQTLAASGVLAASGMGLVSCRSTIATDLTIGMVTFPGYAPFYVAREFGLFEGINVNLVRIESIGDLRAAMLAGRIDAYLATYDIFQSIQGRAPIGKMIYAIDTSVGADGVVGDASVADIAAVIGKRVGAEPGFPPHFVLTYMLYRIGHRLSEATIIDMPSGDVPSAFASGQISVAATYEPYLSRTVPLRPGSRILASSRDLPGLVTDFIVASDNAIANKADALRALIAGWNRALSRIRSQADESFRVMARAFGVAPGEMREFSQVVHWLSLEDNRRMYASDGEDSVYRRFNEVNAALRLNNPRVTAAQGHDYILSGFVAA
jgi:NitT/TauT family transport system substrate-binding protein